MGMVVQEARRLSENNFGEIVLTGVDLTSYGADLPGAPSLGTLVAAILKQVPDLKRLRLSSIDSIEADPVLLRVIAENQRLMPHFHLSVQSGDDLILKRMKRRHGRADIIEFCRTVRRHRPEAAFGADLIAGFPTETEAMFQNSLSLVDQAGLSSLHVFPFSPRPGTPAAKMPQQESKVIKDRAARLRAKGEMALAARYQAMVGQTHEILTERGKSGHTRCFATVKFDRDVAPGRLALAHITGQENGHLTGTVAA
jgi:threonylcarbamoyladenosine tRNA methylthiotransferase MtaB